MSKQLNDKVATATKWSAVAEIVAKLLTPITNMVLARLLTPEAFGIVATLTMIITFAEIFTDAGFQKYLIQHDFRDERDRDESTNVAFWSNLIMSLLIWAIIAIIQDPLADIVGNPGLGYVIVIACAAIPLEAFSSIQMALYKRDLDFKTLFKVRIAGLLVPLVVTIPLAFILRSFWAMVIGIMTFNLVNAALLTAYSRWKPRFFYSFAKFREMFSFSVWSMIEAVSIWLTNYVDVFIVGTMLSQYYLGLYKTSSTLVGQIMGLVTATTTPVLFASLSRLQNDHEEFKKLFLQFLRLVSLLIIPIGVGIFCFSDLITSVILGDQWAEASGFVGLWGLTSALTISLSYYCSEVYRALGRPRLSVLVQWLHIIVLWPAVLISVEYGFEALYITRSIIRLEIIAVNLIVMYYAVRISTPDILRSIMKPFVCSVLMALVAWALRPISDNLWWQILTMTLCAVTYLTVMLSSKKERELLLKYVRKK